MTTHELQQLPPVEFFQHIAEGFEGVKRLQHYAAENLYLAKISEGGHAWGWQIRQWESRSEIQVRAAHRLNAWLKKQITIKMLSL